MTAPATFSKADLARAMRKGSVKLAAAIRHLVASHHSFQPASKGEPHG